MERARSPWGEVVVERDPWGTPTVHARHRAEGVWMTGYLHALDRLVAIRLVLAVAEGRLSAIVGDAPFALRIDRTVQQLRFTADLDAVVAAMAPDVRGELEAYGRGFQAGVARRGRPWPLRALGLDVPAWGPKACVAVHRVLSWFGLTSSTQLAKVVIGELVARGVERRALEALLGAEGVDGLDPQALDGIPWPGDDALLGTSTLGGSNAFAVAGARTASGGAVVLASFHLEVGRLPAALYAIDLRYPDGSYEIGMTVPGEPHLVAGRNPDAAWAYTFGHADNVEVLVRAPGSASPTPRAGAVQPRGAPARAFTLYDLPEGGTLLGDAPDGRLALRWRGFDDAAADQLVLYKTRRARSVAELVDIHRDVAVLSTGAVFGDARGHIAWMHTGRVAARRAGWGPRRLDGRSPDVDEADRPLVCDPPEGFVAAANEHVPGWTVCAEPPYRRERLDELLRGPGAWTAERALAACYDDVDRCALRLVPAWAALLPDDHRLRDLGRWVAGGARVNADRDAAASFHGLHTRVCRALVARLLGEELTHGLVDRLGLLLSFQAALDDVMAGARPELLDDDARREVLGAALHDPRPDSTWLGAARFKNIVADTAVSHLVGLHTAPVRFPGSPTSLFQARRVVTFGEQIVGGPAFHLAMDTGRSGAAYNVAGGASERRFGPGYAAGLDAWRDGGSAHLGPR